MQHPRIKRDPKVMFGKPVIAGTRITDVSPASFCESFAMQVLMSPAPLTAKRERNERCTLCCNLAKAFAARLFPLNHPAHAFEE